METTELVDAAGYFAGHYADVWRAINPPEQTDEEIGFLLSHLPAGSEVVDVMCGPGRHAAGLHAAGHSVTGVDAHPWDDGTTGGHPAGAPEQDRTWERVVADVTAWDPGRVWDAAVCFGNSLTAFDPAALEALLSRVRSWVRPGGLLLVQAWTVAEVTYRRGLDPVTFEVGGYTCELSGTFRTLPARWYSRQTISRGGTPLETLHSVDYLYATNELASFLDRAGFEVTALLGDFDGKDFELGDPQVLLVARAV